MVIAFLGKTEINMAEMLLATSGLIYALIGEMVPQIQLKTYFNLLIPKPLSIGIFYRPPNVNTLLETFLNDLKLIDFKVYFLKFTFLEISISISL